jgi:hypothetical protein
MIRFITRWCVLGLAVCTAAAPALAQQPKQRVRLQAATNNSSAPQGEIRGVVEDDKGQRLAGAVVSALGTTAFFATSDAHGRFALRNMALGPYLVRAHLQGYVAARARVIQVNTTQGTDHVLALTRTVTPVEPPKVLTAGVGGAVPVAEPVEHDHDERAWRLRHAKRSVLKDIGQAAAVERNDDSLFGDSLQTLGRAVGSPARLASSLFADLPLNGQINLLTSTAFDRPQDLFGLDASMPHAVAYMSLVVPGHSGDWLMRGTVTQGDLSSWVVSGAFRRQADATHAYEAGLSYSAQRYIGGNTEALQAMSDVRNVGAMYAYDNWSLLTRLRVGYGAQYARYDYLADESLLSPRASLTLQPLASDSLRLRALVSHRETAPGAGEFAPSSTGLWLPPERTFSQISRDVFHPERVDHVELAAEREWPGVFVIGVRAFRQDVDDQVVTMFGLSLPDSASGVGHYHVASAGDFSARGWGVSVSRAVADGIRASVDYTQANTRWVGNARDAIALASLAPVALRSNERIHDLTATLDSVVAPSATRVFVVYKLNSAFARRSESFSGSLASARFNVQVNQSLPFMSFGSGSWEMLAAVSNLFGEDALDGSVYDESLVVRPPKRILGGVTVRF